MFNVEQLGTKTHEGAQLAQKSGQIWTLAMPIFLEFCSKFYIHIYCLSLLQEVTTVDFLALGSMYAPDVSV